MRKGNTHNVMCIASQNCLLNTFAFALCTLSYSNYMPLLITGILTFYRIDSTTLSECWRSNEDNLEAD